MSTSLKPFSFSNRDIAPMRDNVFGLINSHFDDFFNDLRSQLCSEHSFGKLMSKSTYPKMDMYQNDDIFVVKAAVPGVKPEDVKVEISKDGVVKISGSSSEENHKQDGVSYLSKELKMSQFSRSFSLPSDLKDQNPVAEIKDGILTLSWDCKSSVEKEDVRLIEVKKC